MNVNLVNGRRISSLVPGLPVLLVMAGTLVACYFDTVVSVLVAAGETGRIVGLQLRLKSLSEDELKLSGQVWSGSGGG